MIIWQQEMVSALLDFPNLYVFLGVSEFLFFYFFNPFGKIFGNALTDSIAARNKPKVFSLNCFSA